MKAFCFLKNLLFPPRCIACGLLLEAYHDDRAEEVLCPSCRGEWERAKLDICPVCYGPRMDCRCMGTYMKRAHFLGAISLLSYQVDGHTVGNRVVQYLKNYKDGRAVDFVATQLSYPVRDFLREQSLEECDLLFTWVPRGIKRQREAGLDQSAFLAARLAARFHTRAREVFVRRRGGSAQKQLSYRERKRNADHSFALSEELPPLQGRIVVLVDDVVTSGATMAACAKLLQGRGHRAVFGVCIAKTVKNPSGR